MQKSWQGRQIVTGALVLSLNNRGLTLLSVEPLYFPRSTFSRNLDYTAHFTLLVFQETNIRMTRGHETSGPLSDKIQSRKTYIQSHETSRRVQSLHIKERKFVKMRLKGDHQLEFQIKN